MTCGPTSRATWSRYGATKRGGLSLRTLGLLIGFLIVVNIGGALRRAARQRDRSRGAECAYPVCFIEGTLHFPRPHEVWVAGGEEALERPHLDADQPHRLAADDDPADRAGARGRRDRGAPAR